MPTPEETKTHDGAGLASAGLFEDRVMFDFELLARPQPTDSYYIRNTKNAIPAKIRAASFEEAEKLALAAIGPCIRNHQWEVSLVRFNSSNTQTMASAGLPSVICSLPNDPITSDTEPS